MTGQARGRDSKSYREGTKRIRFNKKNAKKKKEENFEFVEK
jgi:hypothetical protein